MTTKLVLCLAILGSALGVSAQSASGDWYFRTLRLGEETDDARITLKVDGNAITGTLNELKLDGTIQGDKISLLAKRPDGKPFGSINGEIHGDTMTGTMRCNPREADMCDWKATRLDTAPRPPQTHTFVPRQYHRLFSGAVEPVLHIHPGDTVKTTTIDAGGVDASGTPRSLGGNPQTGPFFVEGAIPGDTLAIKINRLHLNRDSAISAGRIAPRALTTDYLRNAKYTDFDSDWKLDLDHATGSLAKPTDRLKNFKIDLHPMLGCIGVAPARKEAIRTGWLGAWGGNLDYNQVREGATVYLPVMQEGALLFVGDAHAWQSDGELAGNALETSMDVEFTVNLIRGEATDGPRFEDSEYIMASGIAGSLQDAMQVATTELARWIEKDYKLSANESNVVLAAAIQYDIAEVVDPQFHVVAKIKKSVLKTLQ
jgi:acetamidase/formamidase